MFTVIFIVRRQYVNDSGIGIFAIETKDPDWKHLNQYDIEPDKMLNSCNYITYWCATTSGRSPANALFQFV